MIDLKKYQTDFDVFSDPMEAKSRSNAIGLGGSIHVYDVNGQAYYMPGGTHKEYLQHMDTENEYTEEDYDEVTEDRMIEALRAVVAEIMNKAESFTVEGEVTKIDSDQRVVYGFASVVSKDGEPVVDLQGDVISPETMEKAATEFMLGARTGLTMHKGEPTTTIIHSLPLTKQIKEAFQISSPYEGWIIAVKVHDDETWAAVKAGAFTGFSIGGKAQRREF